MRVTRNPKSGAMWFVVQQGGDCAGGGWGTGAVSASDIVVYIRSISDSDWVSPVLEG